MRIIKKVIPVFIFLGITFFYVNGQTLPEVSVLTCSPGKEIYSIYGHNALRLHYDNQRDYIFNYGTFDFRTPNFTLKFLRGKLPYHLTVNNYEDFINEYTYQGRSVTEQILNLDSVQKIKLVGFLDNNMKPENREYKYDFFFDNCATRIYDVIQVATEDKIIWKEPDRNHLTHRKIIKQYQKNLPWTDFGIDIIIGSRADVPTSLVQEMFIPDFVEMHLDGAEISGEPVVSEKKKLLTYEQPEISDWEKILFGPVSLFILLLLTEVILLYRTIKNRITSPIFKRYDSLWFGILSGIGVLILIMWFLTDHSPTKDNWNVLWTLPAFGYFITKVKSTKLFLIIIVVSSILTLLQSFQLPVFTQYFHPVFGIISFITFLKIMKVFHTETSQN
jgi:hypothetical protein